MPTRRFLIAFALALFAIQAQAQRARDPLSFFGLAEEEARFLPGAYYFHKGCDAFHRGDVDGAIALWKIAASWGQKSAQYDLGIAYFEGRGIEADRPLGLAWLALAAERKDVSFETSLALAWQQSSEDEHDRANALWRSLRPTYADAVALRRARVRYEQSMREVTGAPDGHAVGNMTVYTKAGRQDSAVYLASLRDQAEEYFGTAKGTVNVGPLEPVTDGPMSPGYSDPPPTGDRPI